jgi:hypothetical protein
MGVDLAGSALLTRSLEGLLFGVMPLDTATYLAAGGLSLVVIVLATSVATRAVAPWIRSSCCARIDAPARPAYSR